MTTREQRIENAAQSIMATMMNIESRDGGTTSKDEILAATMAMADMLMSNNDETEYGQDIFRGLETCRKEVLATLFPPD